jgi:hypothetical protein
VIPWDDEQEIEQKAVKGGFHSRKQLNSWIDQLIAGCVQLLVKQGDELVRSTRTTRSAGAIRGSRRARHRAARDATARQILEAVFAHAEPDPRSACRT